MDLINQQKCSGLLAKSKELYRHTISCPNHISAGLVVSVVAAIFSFHLRIMAFLSFFALQLVLMIVWPKFIIPLFNKLTPLEDGELKIRLMGLAEKSGFHAQSIEVIDGSKRSSHSNAYFTGFGRFLENCSV